MNKWIAIPVIAVLAIAIVVVGYLYLQQTSKLGEAESEIVALEGDVSTLEGNVSTLEGNVSTLETDLADSEATVSTLEGNVSTLETHLAESEATVSTLEADLGTANSRISGLQADVSTQQTINSSLSAELKKVNDSRHFASITELTDWLDQDDTDTKYAGKSGAQLAFILQVRALRNGYLLSALVFEDGEGGANLAVIEDEYWMINPEDDDTEFGWYMDPLPSHPLPLD